jgi:alkanesulfonate monooxygenase SsuD/methylene tetrahydromethanopterin reductase-like flavin-dependent oxidoreductase (luciferase family)
MSLEDLIDRGIMFAGSAATVAGQIERFHNKVGGLGHLLLMGQAGHMGHDETVRGIRRFAQDVVPALARVTDSVPV